MPKILTTQTLRVHQLWGTLLPDPGNPPGNRHPGTLPTRATLETSREPWKPVKPAQTGQTGREAGNHEYLVNDTEHGSI